MLVASLAKNSSMTDFQFNDSPHPIRADLVSAYRNYWHQLASPGTWWTGAERIAIAAESRQAPLCAYCAERKNSLSPYNVEGEHESSSETLLSAEAIDAVHRVITDQTRITKRYIQDNVNSGLSEGKYVELVGVVVCTFSIDEFFRALGLPLEPLPAAIDGPPSGYVPEGLESESGMVAMIRGGQEGPDEKDLWPPHRAPNVLRALSQVPNALREWIAISNAQYLPMQKIGDPGSETERILDRMQIEIVAARISSHNECFY